MYRKKFKYKVGNSTRTVRVSVLNERLAMFMSMIEILRLCWAYNELGMIPESLIYNRDSVLGMRSVRDTRYKKTRSSHAVFNTYSERVFYRKIINTSNEYMSSLHSATLEELYSSSLIHSDNYPLHQFINVSVTRMYDIREKALKLLKQNGYDVLAMRRKPLSSIWSRIWKCLTFKLNA